MFGALSRGKWRKDPVHLQSSQFTTTIPSLGPWYEEGESLYAMRTWLLRRSHITLVLYRRYGHKIRGPLASNKQLLDDLKSIRGEPSTREDDGKTTDDRGGLEASAEVPSIQSRLPQSPLMFRYLGRRSPQTKFPKPQQQRKELSPFQRELQTNIFGHRSLVCLSGILLTSPTARALASPVRMCRLTSTRLPSDFLLQHGLSTHPKTGKKWNLPLLAGRLSQQGKRMNRAQPESSADTIAEGAPEPTYSPQKRTLSGFNILASYKALDLVSKDQASKKHREIIPQSWKDSKGIGKGPLVWREDMADFTLGLLRQEVVKAMTSLFMSTGATDFSSCDLWEDVQAQSSVSSILCLRGDIKATEVGPLEYVRRLSEGCASDVNSWTMAFHREHKVPVFFVKTLMGSKHFGAIREKWPDVLGKELVVLQKKTSTVELQAKFWKLAGFLA